MTDQQRLEALEQAVHGLTRDVERLAREVQEARARLAEAHAGSAGRAAAPLATPVRPASPAGAEAARRVRLPPAAPGAWRALGVETLIGRYGALALAALAILLGVGVFLTWAVEHVELGPGMRVLLGALAAAGVAVLGGVLRARGARRFGSILLGLALAIAHVVAWGAGPFLQVVPSMVAFGGVVLASAALALLAWREDEEALFAVGAGGALLAPFVTAENGTRLFQLLAFGVVVIGAGLAAIRDRIWRIAARILIAGGALYVGAGSSAMQLGLPSERVAPATFALVCAWITIAVVATPQRLRIGRAMLALAVAALLVVGLSRRDALMPDIAVIAWVATISAYVLLAREHDAPAAAVSIVAIVLPLGALTAAVAAMPEIASARTAALAALWTATAAGAAYGQDGARRDAHAFVLALTGATALLLRLEALPHWAVPSLGTWGLALSMAERRARSPGLVIGVTIVLVVASIWAFDLLVRRPAYAYAPFLTAASAACAMVAGAWWALALAASREPETTTTSASLVSSIRFIAPAVTVGWGYVELARAFSPDVATFLVILYLAAVGVAAIVLGRARGLRAARHAGLALAILAGVKALLQASDLAFGLRLASYLVVGAFLLGIAYLYRATSDVPDGVGPARS